MIYFTLLFMLLSVALYFLQLQTLKSNRIWKDRYWKAQAEIDRLYEVIMNNNLLKKDE